MPIYTYKCPRCNIERDEYHSMSYNAKILCTCGAVMKKIISFVGSFQFKGTGFYATDYKRKDNGTSCSS